MSNKLEFCSTVYVINDKKEFLLLYHRKLNKWVPPGGRLNSGDTPHDAALRECYEETGVNIRLLGSKPSINSALLTPFGVEKNPCKDEGYHLDFIFLGIPVAEKSQKLDYEIDNITKWYNLAEIFKLDTFESVLYWCKYFQDYQYDER